MDTQPPASGSRPTAALLIGLASLAADAPYAVARTIDELAFGLQLGREPSALAEEIGLLAAFTSEDADDWHEAGRWEDGGDGADPDALRIRAEHYRRVERLLRG